MTSKTSIYETFLLAKDKEAYLESIKTTQEYKNLIIHHRLNQGKPVPDQFTKTVSDAHGEQHFVIKKLLLQLEAETDQSKKEEILNKLNDKFLHINFQHQRNNGSRQVAGKDGEKEEKLQTKLSASMDEFTNLEKLIESFYADKKIISNFNKIGRENLHKIEILKLQKADSQINLLRNLENYLHFDNIGFILKSVKENYQKQHSAQKRTWTIDVSIWNKCTLEQLNQAAEVQEIQDNLTLNLRRFRLENSAQLAIITNRLSEQELKEQFTTLQKKVQTNPRYADLVRYLNKCLLVNSVKMRDIDVDRYEDFLNNPFFQKLGEVFIPEINKKFREKPFIRMNNNWNIFPWYVNSYPDTSLVQTGKKMIATTEANVKRFSKYFHEEELKRLLVEHQTLNGGPIEAYQAIFGQHSTNQLINRKNLLILDTNCDNFENKKVEISLKIKNIESLEVRQFQVDTVNYLKQNMKYPDQSMDLDGLIPEKKNVHTYTNPKHEEHTQTFTFPDIDAIERGIFIIDFVGGGLMSRAVIKKGTLSVMSKPSEYGYEFFILNSNKGICTGKGTGIFVDGKFIPVNDEGAVSIPYDSLVFNKNGVLIHDNFGYLGHISVPKENYQLKSTLFFNDEGILPGKNAQLLLRTRLYLNNQSISINKLKDVNIILSTSTLDGITNTKVFDGVKLKDDEDFVIDFMVPNKLINFNVNLTAKAETVGHGDINLNFNENVDINRGEYTDKISQGFFRQTPEGFFFDVKGKNGEPIPKVPVTITISRVFDKQNKSESVYTNENGTVTLGKLENVLSINASYQGELVASKICNDRIVDMPVNYSICKGEDLVLPSKGLTLNKDNVELIQLDAKFGGIIGSSFDKIKAEDTKNFVIGGLEPGSYQLIYKTSGSNSKVTIRVLDAKRWNHSPLMIETENQLRSVSGELRFINIQSIEKGGENLNINISSNDIENTVVHVLGYNYNPVLADYMSDLLMSTTSQRLSKNVSIAETRNIYISGKNLGDEMNYVLNRKNKKNFIGNTLKKPSILLHRKFIRETTEDEEKLKQETNFDINTMTTGMRMKKERAPIHNMSLTEKCVRVGTNGRAAGPSFQAYKRNYDIYANYEYISESGLTLSNLKPNDNGQVQIPIQELGDYSQLVIFASDTYGHVMTKHNFKQTKTNNADLRLSESKPAGIIYTEDRFCLPVCKGATTTVKDLKNCQISFLETQKDILDALLVIFEGDKTSLNEWKFLTIWGSLSEEEKLKKFDKYGGDELNVFTYIKDREFFNKKILPILRFKSESRLLDHILTKNEEEFERLFTPQGVSKLSPLELTLLLTYYKDSKAQLCKTILASLEAKVSARIKNDVQKNQWLDSIISSKKVELEDDDDFADDDNEELEELEKEMCMEVQECNTISEPPMAFSMERAPVVMAKAMPMGGMMKRRMAPQMLKADKIVAKKKPVQIQRYKKAGAAFEYGERHQFFDGSNSQGSIHEFWLNIMKNIVSGKGNQILSENFIYASYTNYNIVYALAFTDLPFTKGSINSKTVGKDLEVSSTENFLVLVKKMEEKVTDPLNMDLIVSQKFYDPAEKFTYDETDSSIKTIKEVTEFLIGKIYESQITFTNISENNLKLKVIQQIPQGSLPVYNLDDLKIHDVHISGLQTQKITFKFYFPCAGTFSCYPATVTKNNRFIAHSNIPAEFKVVEKFERGNKVLESLQDILNYGSPEDILKFMTEKNLYNSNIFSMHQVYWLLQDKKHYSEVLKILKDKCFFDSTAWSYSIKHGDMSTFEEWTKNTDYFDHHLRQLKYFKNNYANIDRFKPLEYDPLINARAHSISDKKQNILNKDFRKTYENFLEYCVERPTLGEREKIILTSYFTLQDRIEEALVLVKTINGEEVKNSNIMVVQYDYLRAYLSIFQEFPSFKTAREITKTYTQFPDLSWRKMFLEIANQLAEYDGTQGTKIQEDEDMAIEHVSNKEQSEKAEYLKAEHKQNSKEITLTYNNLSGVTVSYFKLNMEILFSKDPFLDKNINNFSFVNPNAQQKIVLSPSTDFSNATITVPQELQSSSLFVHIQGKSRSTTLKIFNSNLRVHAIEDFGLLKIADKSGKILNSIYVKCYYKGKGGETKFYKDGYSDFRGSFDYASLNSNSLDKVDTFALLVTDETHGSTIIKVKPPKKVGTMAQLLKLNN